MSCANLGHLCLIRDMMLVCCCKSMPSVLRSGMGQDPTHTTSSVPDISRHYKRIALFSRLVLFLHVCWV
jgi:hypothetical protein